MPSQSFSHLNRMLNRGVEVFAASFVLVIGLLVVQEIRSGEAVKWVRHSYDVIREIERLRAYLIDRDTGMRGYVLTGDPAFLAPYLRCQSNCPDGRHLVHLTRDNPGQQQLLTPLPNLVAAFERDLAALRNEVGSGSRLRAEAMVAERVGKRHLDGIRQILREAEETEDQLLAVRQRTNARQQALLKISFAVGSGLMLIALVVLYRRSRAAISAVDAADEALRHSEERVRSILANAPDAFISIDEHGAVSEWNRQAEQTLGWPRSAAIGQPLAELVIPPAHRAAHLAGMARFARTGEGAVVNNRVEVMALRRDGTEVPIELSVSAVQSGSQFIANAFLRDITERKRAEEVLRKSHEAIRHAAQAKSEFLATMSHELRTPLNGVLGFATALEQRLHEPEDRELAAHIRQTGEALNRILNDVLDFSKIEAHKLALEQRAFRLSELIDSCRALFAPQAAAKGVRLLVRADGSLVAGPHAERGHHPLLLGDPVRLRQVLHNLLSNAVKFTSHGQIVLSVQRCASINPDGSPAAGAAAVAATAMATATATAGAAQVAPAGSVRLRFEVRDSGIGLTAEQQARLFRRFEQADASTARKYGGTGLGLAIVHGIVGQMGGDILVESELGTGSVFSFELEFALQPSDSSASPIAGTASGTAPDSAHAAEARPLKVLVADDTPLNRKVVRVLLNRRGHEVIEAADGEEAVRCMQEHRIDLVLMDLQMPEVDGLEGARRIRSLPAEHGGRVPIYALSGSVFEEDRAQSQQAGMDGHLAKPLRLEQLLPVLQLVASLPAEALREVTVE